MSVEVTINSKKPAAASLLAAEFLKNSGKDVKVVFGDGNSLSVEGSMKLTSDAMICRYLCRKFDGTGLLGTTILERTEVDHWLTIAADSLTCASDFQASLQYLDQVLQSVTYLVGHSFTVADFAIWACLHTTPQWHNLMARGKAPCNVSRYYGFLSAQEIFKTVATKIPKVAVNVTDSVKTQKSTIKKEEGKFVDLPGAKMGEVVVRFPPEASGYLHVGHAKAALLNEYYQQMFNGVLIMRFDDTNPAKENAEFEKVILEDVAMLGIKYDRYSHTSDHFDALLDLCEKMIKSQNAFVDNTEAEQMKKEREERVNSSNRDNSIEKNLKLWQEMKAGTATGKTCCVRAKINMNSDNGCMRDPTIFRCKTEEHVKTGTKYKAYPTYDFACPIVDSIEGVTHALRTTEYHDRDEQYYWILDALDLRKPHIYEYSRLNLQNTVLSKRKLTWFVDQGLVDGWDDPRFPTVRGVLRRGMTVEGLKQFIVSQGSSRSVVMMEWDKIWAVNKKVIDPVVPRYTALQKDEVVVVRVKGVKEDKKMAPKHPKNSSIGEKVTWLSPTVYIDGADAEHLKTGELVTFINWGNMKITGINRENDKIVSVDAEANLENTDYKKTQKLTWLAVTEQGPFVPTVCVQFDNIISKGVLAKDEDFKSYVNKDSKAEQEMLGDPCLRELQKGDIIQLQRRGFYICDQPYQSTSCHSGRESPCVLFYIPDGHQKDMPTSGSKHKPDTAQKQTGSKDATSKQQGSAKQKSKGKEDKVVEEAPVSKKEQADISNLDAKICSQGDKIRTLKESKAPKDQIKEEVTILLSLKAEYKSATGKDWKPESAASAPKQSNPSRK
ncbi:hypothetical protein ScPMuIL_014038 [Solemya velum]